MSTDFIPDVSEVAYSREFMIWIKYVSGTEWSATRYRYL